MERTIIKTRDGSHTIEIPALQAAYHSYHGAIQESMHVYINAGLLPLLNKQYPCIEILEIGFGTGLNALLSLMQAEEANQKIHYTAVELYPLRPNEFTVLNYCEQLGRQDLFPVFQSMHECEWEKSIAITPSFTLKKIQVNLASLPDLEPARLVYFDAFAPSSQPELWTTEIFRKIKRAMSDGGILVTYCSKSIVRRALQEAGFIVQKLQGPYGKREMVKATLFK